MYVLASVAKSQEVLYQSLKNFKKLLKIGPATVNRAGLGPSKKKFLVKNFLVKKIFFGLKQFFGEKTYFFDFLVKKIFIFFYFLVIFFIFLVKNLFLFFFGQKMKNFFFDFLVKKN